MSDAARHPGRSGAAAGDGDDAGRSPVTAGGTHRDARPADDDAAPRTAGPADNLDRRAKADWPARLQAAINALRGRSDEDADGEIDAARLNEDLMVKNVRGFKELRVEDVMVPRAEIIAVDVGTALDDLLRVFHKAGHSRLPVYRETLDDPLGMVHIKDVLGVIIEAEDAARAAKATPGNGNGHGNGQHKLPLYKLKRDVLFVPPSMPVADLLLKMQASRQHMALVIDEYGGTDGLVTIEDLVEEIVGDIEDEHDVAQKLRLRRRPDGGFDANARVEIEEFENFSGLDVRLDPDEEEEVDTLGGIVFSLLGRVPQRGEVVPHPNGLEFHVVDADARRIRRLQVHRAAGTRKNETGGAAGSGETGG